MVSGPSAPRSQLDALSDAIRALTTEISIERVLRRLAEISAHLVNARYAALGVPSEMGRVGAVLYVWHDRTAGRPHGSPAGGSRPAARTAARDQPDPAKTCGRILGRRGSARLTRR
ncbi:MAG: hypothetical protein HND48_16720 [Chloroflexi bacterium]|nr:hypothetical protein [Chloroflexota bacterium]